jgi:uncharacterized membrane protein YdfJ with MMPL/SSD domain
MFDGFHDQVDQGPKIETIMKMAQHYGRELADATWAEATAPWLWNSVVKIILDQPVFAVLGIVGILLMILFRPRKPLIGYSRD